MLPRDRWFPALRALIGSVLGIIGFGTLSLGFAQWHISNLLLGLGEMLIGTFLALGVLTPLRRRHSHPSA